MTLILKATSVRYNDSHVILSICLFLYVSIRFPDSIQMEHHMPWLILIVYHHYTTHLVVFLVASASDNLFLPVGYKMLVKQWGDMNSHFIID